MILRNDALLRAFQTPGPCEWCGKMCKQREAAHIFAKGMGGGHRLDIRINLLALGLGAWAGRAAECSCHWGHHNGKSPTRAQMLEVAAKREGTTPEAIEWAILILKRIKAMPTAEQVAELAAKEGAGNEVARLILAAIGESE